MKRNNVGVEIKVMHLLGSLRPSGMERMLVSGSTHFNENGIESIVVGQGEIHPYAGDLEKAGYRIAYIPPVRRLSGALALRRLISAERPHVLHIHSESGYAGAAVSAFLAPGSPSVVRTIHNVFSPTGRTKLTRRVQSIVGDSVARALIVPSPDVQANEARFGRTTALIYNWVSDGITEVGAQPRTRARGPASALIVGNCSAIKNHDLVLELLFEGGFDLYHHGNEEEATGHEKAMLAKFEAAGRLRYRGTAEPAGSLAQASIYVMPSTQEGMPVALAEALSFGIPALVSDAPGLRWAGPMRGVRIVSNTRDAWSRALSSNPEGLEEYGGTEPPNFSAARGVGEYVRQYRRIAVRASGGKK